MDHELDELFLEEEIELSFEEKLSREIRETRDSEPVSFFSVEGEYYQLLRKDVIDLGDGFVQLLTGKRKRIVKARG